MESVFWRRNTDEHNEQRRSNYRTETEDTKEFETELKEVIRQEEEQENQIEEEEGMEQPNRNRLKFF